MEIALHLKTQVSTAHFAQFAAYTHALIEKKIESTQQSTWTFTSTLYTKISVALVLLLLLLRHATISKSIWFVHLVWMHWIRIVCMNSIRWNHSAFYQLTWHSFIHSLPFILSHTFCPFGWYMQMNTHNIRLCLLCK